jgi:hypothetical protein
VIGVRGLVFAMAAILATSCSASNSVPASWPDLGPAWPDEGWMPVAIDLSALDPLPGAVTDHGAGSSPTERQIRDARDAGELLEQHYPQARLFASYESTSAGVRVVYFENEDRFFLQEDHMMGHYDGFIGPFHGDPRLILAELVS